MSQHSEKAALEIWAMVNEDGEYVASHDEDSLVGFYADGETELALTVEG